MGLTPLAGLIMGTRSGDIDPSIANYVAFRSGNDIAEITRQLNKESGIKALTGHADMRDIEAEINQGSQKAILGMKL
jgi:acetate kinase